MLKICGNFKETALSLEMLLESFYRELQLLSAFSKDGSAGRRRVQRMAGMVYEEILNQGAHSRITQSCLSQGLSWKFHCCPTRRD